MHCTTLFLAVRPGGGTKPAVVVAGEADGVVEPGRTWPEVTGCRILHIEHIPGSAGLAALQDRVRELHRQLGERLTTKRHALDVTIDVTSEPMAAEMLREVLPGAWTYVTVTGSQIDEPGFGMNKVGREALLSDLRVRLARSVLEVRLPKEASEEFRKALDQATVRPPKTEAEGLPLTDTDAGDDLVMCAALAVWRAFRHPPMPPILNEPGSRWNRPLRRSMGGIV